jgi:BlaI family transcriptional regulator, penicillinase repressor
MARHTTAQPTNGELNILRLLWERGPSRLSAICEALGQERKVAATTVATMLKIMKRKGQVRRRLTRSGIVWQATLSQADAGSSMLANLLAGVFEGSAQKLVLHLLERGHLSETDQRQIRELLASNHHKPPL